MRKETDQLTSQLFNKTDMHFRHLYVQVVFVVDFENNLQCADIYK